MQCARLRAKSFCVLTPSYLLFASAALHCAALSTAVVLLFTVVSIIRSVCSLAGPRQHHQLKQNQKQKQKLKQKSSGYIFTRRLFYEVSNKLPVLHPNIKHKYLAALFRFAPQKEPSASQQQSKRQTDKVSTLY